MEALTLDRVKELAHEVVAEVGEAYVYPESHKRREPESSINSCVYVHDGKPSCIVGRVLHKAGVELAVLAQREFVGAWFVAGDLGATVPASDFLDSIQGKQDAGWSWGDALKAAIAELS